MKYQLMLIPISVPPNFEQVQNGKYIRMALIMSLLELTDPLTGKKYYSKIEWRL